MLCCSVTADAIIVPWKVKRSRGQQGKHGLCPGSCSFGSPLTNPCGVFGIEGNTELLAEFETPGQICGQKKDLHLWGLGKISPREGVLGR